MTAGETPYTIHWLTTAQDTLSTTDNAGTLTVSPEDTTSYVAYATTQTGCRTANSNAVTVTVIGTPTPQLTTVNPIYCGETVELTVDHYNADYTYYWYNESDSLLFVGYPYVTDNLSDNTTFKVRAAVQVDAVRDFEYTGAAQSFTVPAGVTELTLEAWGAQGGNGYYDSYDIYGGKGGYSTGTLVVNPGETIFVAVGGQGENATNVSSPSYICYGGYNGGGNSPANNSSYARHGGAGGGATDFRLNDTSSLYNRILVAGGGGGGSYYGEGGAGGGQEASAGSGSYCGYGGTQSSGGSYGSYNYSGYYGDFGFGGEGANYGGAGGGVYKARERIHRGMLIHDY